jgi:hypothetical protein
MYFAARPPLGGKIKTCVLDARDAVGRPEYKEKNQVVFPPTRCGTKSVKCTSSVTLLTRTEIHGRRAGYIYVRRGGMHAPARRCQSASLTGQLL